MRPTVIALAGLCSLIALGAQSPPRLILTNARVLDPVAGRVRHVHAVVIEGEKVVAVHETAPAALPEPAVRLDVTGKTLVPGLADLAVQTLPGLDLDTDFFYALCLAHGVTRIRAVDVRLPWAIQQRDRLARGLATAPRTWTSGPVIDMRTALGQPGRPLLAGGLEPIAQVADATAAGREAAAQVRRGVDWIRVGEQAPPDVVRAVVAATRGSRTQVSLAAGATSMLQAAQLGVALIDGLGAPVKAFGETGEGTGEAVAPGSGGDRPQSAPAEALWARLAPRDRQALIAQLVRARVAVAPMLLARIAGTSPLKNEAYDLELLPERLRPNRSGPTPGRAESRESPRPDTPSSLREFVVALQKAGGRLIVASGARADGWPVPGLGVHRELALLVEAGLTPAEAIRAATSVPAELLGDRLGGRIEPGAPADFFGVSGDPLSDIAVLRSIELIIMKGEVLDRQRLLAEARRSTGVVPLKR